MIGIVTFTDATPVRRMILRMIANGSLSAFSVGVLGPQFAGRTTGLGAAAARLPRAAQGQARPSNPFLQLGLDEGGVPPRDLPRGSLLDISV